MQAIAFAIEMEARDVNELDPSTPEFQSFVDSLQQEGHMSAIEHRELTNGREGWRVSFSAPFMPFSLGLNDLIQFGLFPFEGEWHHEIYWIRSADDRGFLFWYWAPPLLYFERDLPVFERLVASFEAPGVPRGTVSGTR